MSRPRLRLLEPDAWPVEMRNAADGPLGALNVIKALMHHPDLFRRWSVLANHFLYKCTLPASARELLILRVAWLTDCEYEWSQHAKMSAEACGFGRGHLADIQAGAGASRWNTAQKALLALADSLVLGLRVPDRVWDHVVDNWEERQAIDAVGLIGNYVMLAMALNALGVPPDPGYPGFDEQTPARPKPDVHVAAPVAPSGAPRLGPLRDHEMDRSAREMLAKARGAFPSVNVLDTIARHPDLLRRWMPLFAHCLHKQSLNLRQREIVILRTGWLAGSAYEWSQHVPIARQRGVKAAEIEAVTAGPAHPTWSSDDRAILESVDA
ncbi:MAG: carboxymuconolactone decarboxylase family protein, partial [Alphaproteobacteria bacterium]